MTSVLRLCALGLFLLVSALAASGEAAERRVALVIGNAQYRQGGSLPTVAANAAAVAEALRRTGFDVTVATNQEHRGLVAALSHFATRAKGAELGLIYYSGLALSVGGRNFLVPVDAKLTSDIDVSFDTIELDQVLQQMQAPARGVLLLDPVMPNPLVGTLTRGVVGDGRRVRPVPGAPGQADTLLIGYSHQPDTPPPAAHGSGSGPYAAALAQELTKPGADLRGALTAVERTVVQRTGGAQTPWMQDRLGPTVALLPASPPEPAPELKVEALEGRYVTTRDTNLRQTPDTRAPVLRTVARNTTVTATGQTRGWTRVTLDGQQGFITAGNLRRADSPEPGSEPKPEAPPVAAAPEPGPRRVLRAATLFDRPALGARGVRDLPSGMMVTVLEAVPGSNWVKVRDRFAQEGYVPAGALGAGGEPPLPSAAPTAVVTREESLALSGASGEPPPRGSEMAAVPPDGGPVPEAVRAARDSAASGESAAAQARTTAQRAAEAQALAREAAEEARAGTPHAWVHRFANGDLYEGEWTVVGGDSVRRVVRSGHGIYHFADGQLYEGEWRDDQMAGAGVMSFRTGDRFAGTFRAGQPEGLGVFRYGNGDAFAGEVRRNRPEGPGELAYANGDRYVGRVSDRQPSGYGALTLNSTGLRHLGRFRDGVQDGPGMATTGDGGQRSGVWHGARMVGE